MLPHGLMLLEHLHVLHLALRMVLILMASEAVPSYGAGLALGMVIFLTAIEAVAACVRQEVGSVKAGYADSIESLVRNNIQKMKIDMANEVIDAGRFDMNTTMDERRQTLEEMLQVCL